MISLMSKMFIKEPVTSILKYSTIVLLFQQFILLL